MRRNRATRSPARCVRAWPDAVVAGARPAELGDDDALAGMGAAQLVVEFDGLANYLVGRYPFPVRQDMGGDEIDRRSKLGVVDPHRPDFTGGNRHRALPFHPLDDLDQLGDGLLRAIDRLVADHDGIDVAVAPRERNRRLDLPLVAGFVLVDPDAERHLESELGGDCRHQLDAAGGAVGADRLRIGAQDLQIVANLLLGWTIATIRMLRACVRRIRDAGQRRLDVGDRLLPLEQRP